MGPELSVPYYKFPSLSCLVCLSVRKLWILQKINKFLIHSVYIHSVFNSYSRSEICVNSMINVQYIPAMNKRYPIIVPVELLWIRPYPHVWINDIFERKLVNVFLSIDLYICFGWIFSYLSVLAFVLGAQKNCLIETVLLSTQNICIGWEIRKIIFITHSYLEAC